MPKKKKKKKKTSFNNFWNFFLEQHEDLFNDRIFILGWTIPLRSGAWVPCTHNKIWQKVSSVIDFVSVHCYLIEKEVNVSCWEKEHWLFKNSWALKLFFPEHRSVNVMRYRGSQNVRFSFPHQHKHGWQELPADTEEEVWFLSQHMLHHYTEPSHSCERARKRWDKTFISQ